MTSARGHRVATRDALEGKGPQRWPQKRLGRRLEEGTKADGGGYCRLQMPLRLAHAVRETVAGRRLDALEGGGGGRYPPPFQCIPGRNPGITHSPALLPGTRLHSCQRACKSLPWKARQYHPLDYVEVQWKLEDETMRWFRGVVCEENQPNSKYKLIAFDDGWMRLFRLPSPRARSPFCPARVQVFACDGRPGGADFKVVLPPLAHLTAVHSGAWQRGSLRVP